MHHPKLLPLLLALVVMLSAPGVLTAGARQATPDASPAAGAAPGADWPQFHANPEHTGTGLGPGPSSEGVVRWRVETGGGTQSPAVADGVVYVVSDANYLFALDAQTGEERWRVPAAGGAYSAPAVGDGVVVAGTLDGLLAVDAATGEERWRFPAGEDALKFTQSAPTIADGVVYAAEDDLANDPVSNLYAFDAATGDERWRFEAGIRIPVTPTVAGGLVYIATDPVYSGAGGPAAIIALDAATGEERWRYESSDEADTFFSSPAVADGTLYIGSQGDEGFSNLHAVDAATGEERWRWDVSRYSPVFSSPAVADGSVYVGADALYAVDAASGEQRWRLGIGEVWSSPAIVDGVVYVATDEGFLVAADAASGEMLWNVEIGPSFFSSSSPAVADGLVYVHGRYGFFYAIGGADDAADAASAAATPAAADETPYADVAADLLIDETLAPDLLPTFPAFMGLWQTTWPAGSVYERRMDSPGVQISCVRTGQWAYSLVEGDGSATADGATPAAAATPGPETVLNPGDCVTLTMDVHRNERNPGDVPAEVFDLAILPGDYPGPEGRDPEITDENIVFFDPPLVSQLLPGPIDVTVRAADLGPGAAVGAYDGEGLGQIGAFYNRDTHLSRRIDGSVRNLGDEPLTAYLMSAQATGVAADDATPAATDAESATEAEPEMDVDAAASPAADATDDVATFVWAATGGPAPFAGAGFVAVAPDGNVWVSDGGENRYQIFAPDGTFLEIWGESGSGDGEFDFTRANGDPIGGSLAFDADGNLFVADIGNRRVQKFDADRNFVAAWGSFGTGDGEFVDPICMDVDLAGNVYVGDDRREDIQKFDNEGAYLETLSGHGSEPGQVTFLGCIDIDADGNIFVADFGNDRVQKLAPDGSPLLAWGDGGSEDGQFIEVNGVAVDADGNVFVADSGNRRVQVFDGEGSFLGSFGSAGDGDGQFAFPISLAFDGQGHVYVADIDLNRVQKFRLGPIPPAAATTPEA